jgi:hypothetical protein
MVMPTHLLSTLGVAAVLGCVAVTGIALAQPTTSAPAAPGATATNAATTSPATTLPVQDASAPMMMVPMPAGTLAIDARAL